MLFIGYGSMLIESILAVVSLIVVGAAATGRRNAQRHAVPDFCRCCWRLYGMFGLSAHVATCVITMCVSALALTTLDPWAYSAVCASGTFHLRKPEEMSWLPEADDQQIFCNRYHPVLRLSALPGRIYERMAVVRRSQPAVRSAGIHFAFGIP